MWDKLTYYLGKRPQHVHYEIFSEVESDPSIETIQRGVRAMNLFQPDVIIALGGGIRNRPLQKACGCFMKIPTPILTGCG